MSWTVWSLKMLKNAHSTCPNLPTRTLQVPEEANCSASISGVLSIVE